MNARVHMFYAVRSVPLYAATLPFDLLPYSRLILQHGRQEVSLPVLPEQHETFALTQLQPAASRCLVLCDHHLAVAHEARDGGLGPAAIADEEAGPHHATPVITPPLVWFDTASMQQR